jgi:hypothetical protein
MTRKQEEIVSLTIVGILIATMYYLVIYVIHNEVKKQEPKQETFQYKKATDWNITELTNKKRLYYDRLSR